MVHDHSKHHREEMVKNLIQAEDHLRKDFCPECLDKHLLGGEAYMEEELSTNPDAERELLELAEKVRQIRRKIQEMNNIKHENDTRKIETTL